MIKTPAIIILIGLSLSLLSACATTTCSKLDDLIIEQNESWQSIGQDSSELAMYHLGILTGYEFTAIELGCELK